MRELIHTAQKDGFEIHVYALPEDISPVGQFASGDDAADQEIIDKIDSGDLTWFVAQVTASKEGVELGSDYLGACCYLSYDDFIKSNDYYEDMVNVAISEAKAKLNKLCAC